jgi:hypothetical protein
VANQHSSRAAHVGIGVRFGRMVVEQTAGHGKEGPLWACRCDCGGEKLVSGKDIRKALRGKGGVKSCGCLHRETGAAQGRKSATHGHTRHGRRTPEYWTWIWVKQRCENPRVNGYEQYGAKGVRVLPDGLRATV